MATEQFADTAVESTRPAGQPTSTTEQARPAPLGRWRRARHPRDARDNDSRRSTDDEGLTTFIDAGIGE